MKIVVTGFGIFRDYNFNPSWEAVSGLPDVWNEEKHSLHCEQIPVEYDFVLQQVPAKWREIDPDFIVHVGVSHLADKLTLEKHAHNTGYNKPDIRSMCPPDQRCVPECQDTSRASCLDMEKLMVSVNEDFSKQGMGVEACVSEDAGHYLCDFVYFKSLHSMCGKSLFVHVPEVGEGKPYSIQQMTRGLSVIIKNIISQIEK